MRTQIATPTPYFPQVLTTERAMEYTGLTHGEICAAIRRGDIKARKVGRKYLISKASIDRLVESGNAKSKA